MPIPRAPSSPRFLTKVLKLVVDIVKSWARLPVARSFFVKAVVAALVAIRMTASGVAAAMTATAVSTSSGCEGIAADGPRFQDPSLHTRIDSSQAGPAEGVVLMQQSKVPHPERVQLLDHPGALVSRASANVKQVGVFGSRNSGSPDQGAKSAMPASASTSFFSRICTCDVPMYPNSAIAFS